MKHTSIDPVQEILTLPFGLYFRQVLPLRLDPQAMAETTSEPEITTGDGKDPDKIDSIWIADEDEGNDDDDDDDEKRITSILAL